jgi:hypothetical protein
MYRNTLKNSSVQKKLGCLILGAVVAACSNAAEDIDSPDTDGSSSTAVTNDITDVTVENTADPLAALLAGETIQIVLDRCDEDDVWEGPNDPYGALLCGQSYDLSFDSRTSEWVATGFNEAASARAGEPQTETIRRPGTYSGGTSLSVWGISFQIDPTSRLISHDGEVVGHAIASN